MPGADPFGWVGQTIEERVAIEEVVGEGGFGVVYRGRHLGFDEPVAVKCLKIPPQLHEDQVESFVQSFKAEARLLHRLSRKTTGIVQALDYGALLSPSKVWTPYIVMEWLDGQSLEEDLARRVRKGLPARTVRESVSLLRPAADALGVAHAHAVAHLDIKPANLFVCVEDVPATAGTPAGTATTVKVLDFGIARVMLTKTMTRALTSSSFHAFTPAYAAPEQYDKSHGDVGPHTDVFALGLILLEIVSGRTALDGDSLMQLYMCASNPNIRPSFASHGVEAVEPLEDVLRCALDVHPRRRFPDATSMWEALEAALESATDEAAGDTLPPAVVPKAIQPISVIATPGPDTSPMAKTAVAPAAVTSTGQNRVCTVLLAELMGTEPLVDVLDPEQVDQVVGSCFAILRECVTTLGGECEELAGHTMLAAFGVRSDSVNSAERAVQASLRLCEALKEHEPRGAMGAKLRVRVGVNTGRVFVRRHDPTRQGLGITGTAIKVATRLQHAAKAAEVVISHDTFRHVSGFFDTESRRVAAPDDILPELTAYRVLAASQKRHELSAVAGLDFYGIRTRFVGRAAELEELARVVEESFQGKSSRRVVMLGERGMGKSRLLVEVASRLREDKATVLSAACAASTRATSYGAIGALLRTAFAVHDDDDVEVARMKLRRGVDALRSTQGSDRSRIRSIRPGPRTGRTPPVFSANRTRPSDPTRPSFPRRPRSVDGDEIVNQLLRALGYTQGMASRDGVTMQQESASIKHRIAAAFCALVGASGGPVALLFDDAHQADDASMELLDDLLVRMADQPILVVLSGQPELRGRRDWTRVGGSTVEVGRLARRQLSQIARDRLQRVEDLPDEVVDQLIDRADGCALALVETVQLLVDVGAVDVQAERWRLDHNRVGQLSLPTTVQEIVQARIDQLDDMSREVLCRAAVMGQTFWDSALTTLFVDHATVVPGALAQLSARGLVHVSPTSRFPGMQELVFAENATQEVAYEMLGGSARRQIHRLAADWLEERSSGDVHAAMLAHHYERAAAPLEAIEAYVRAGRNAARLGQNIEAADCFEQACRLDGWLTGEREQARSSSKMFFDWDSAGGSRLPWGDRVSVRVSLGDVMRRMGRFDEAEDVYTAAVGLVGDDDGTESARWRARIAYRRAAAKWAQGLVAEPMALLTRALEHASAGDIPDEKAHILALVAACHVREGDLDSCRRVSLEGLRVCRSILTRGSRWREAVSTLLRTLGGAFNRTGRLVQAERLYLQACRVLDAEREPHLASRAVNNVATVRYQRGDMKSARDSFEQALELAERSGDMWMTMTALSNVGEVERVLKNYDVAQDALEEAAAMGEQIGAQAELAEILRNLSLTLHALGDGEGAMETVRRSLELARNEGGRLYLESVINTMIEVATPDSRADVIATLQPIVREDLAVHDPDAAKRCLDKLGV